MKKAVWIIAICEVIRVVQATVHMVICKINHESEKMAREKVLEEIKSLDAEREDRFWQMACGDD